MSASGVILLILSITVVVVSSASIPERSDVECPLEDNPKTVDGEVVHNITRTASCVNGRRMAGCCVARNSCNFSTDVIDLTLYGPPGFRITWNVTEESDPEKYQYYYEFIELIADVSFRENLQNFWKYQTDDTVKGIDLLDLALTVHPSSVLQVIVSNNDHEYFIHSPYEISTAISNPTGEVLPGEELIIDYKAYSFSLCQMHCRSRMAVMFCGCRPYFHVKGDGDVCDAHGMACIGRNVEILINIPKNLAKCTCLPQCAELNYYSHTKTILVRVTRWHHCVVCRGQRADCGGNCPLHRKASSQADHQEGGKRQGCGI